MVDIDKVTLKLSGREGKDWLLLAEPTAKDGVPVKTFRKAIVRIGKFVKEADGIEFEVTPKALSNWVNQFHKMKKNGVKVSIPSKHSGEGDPDKNRGYVKDLFVDGDALVMTCEMIGEDAIAAVTRSDVSIHSPPKYVDGNGIVYDRPIVSVALCTDPVVTGLGEFIPIAASLRKEGFLMDWKKVQEAMDIKEDLTDENAVDLICSTMSSFKKKLDDIEASLKKKDDDSGKKNDDDKKDDADLKASIKSVDPIHVRLLSDNRKIKLDALVTAGRVTPAVCDMLSKQFVDQDALKLELSLGVRLDEFDKVIAAFAANDPVKLKEMSGPQTLELSGGPSKSDDADICVKDAQRRAKEHAAMV